MNLSERILRIATSHWTERSCFALTLAAALTGDGRMWIAAGTAGQFFFSLQWSIHIW